MSLKTSRGSRTPILSVAGGGSASLKNKKMSKHWCFTLDHFAGGPFFLRLWVERTEDMYDKCISIIRSV